MGSPALVFHPVAASLLLVAAAVAVYLNTLGNPFLLDDQATVVQNLLVHRADVAGIFTTPSWFAQGLLEQGYRPLVSLTFALNYALGGLQPYGYHVANALLHAAVCVMVYLLALELGAGAAAALGAGLLYAVHPLNTEAVASVTGRAEEMAALFVLLGLWLDLRSYRWSGWRRAAAATGVVLSLALGLLSKENAVTLVAGVAATDWLVRCRGSVRRWARGLWGARGALYAGLLLAVGLYVMWRLHVQHGVMPSMNAAMNPLRAEPLWVRWVNAVVIAARYLWLWVVPVKLSADYMLGALPVIHTVWAWRVWAGAAALAGCVGLGVWGWRRGLVALTWGVLVSACTYSVVSNVAVAIQAMMAERWMYLPSVGLCVAAAVVWAEVLLGGGVKRKVAGMAMASIVLMLYGARTVTRNRDWHDSLRLWAATARAVPGSYKAQQGLGKGYLEAGDYAQAAQALERAVALYREPRALEMLGDAYMKLGKRAPARAVYGEAIARLQGQPDADWQIGQLYIALMEPGRAVPALEKARNEHPQVGRIRVDLGKAYYLSGRSAAARAQFEDALRLDPTLGEAHIGLAACAQVDQDYQTAVHEYLRALERGEPAGEGLRRQLVVVLTAYASGHADAPAYARAALRYFPGDEALQRLAAGPTRR